MILGVAAEALKPEVVESTVSKMRRIFNADLVAAARTGECSQVLFGFSMSIRLFLFSDVQSVEGMNSLVKHLCTQSKHIKLCTLSARAVLKRAMGLGSAGSKSKWTVLRPRAAALLDAWKQNFHEGPSQRKRWWSGGLGVAW
jgi:hypothetical protein